MLQVASSRSSIHLQMAPRIKATVHMLRNLQTSQHEWLQLHAAVPTNSKPTIPSVGLQSVCGGENSW